MYVYDAKVSEVKTYKKQRDNIKDGIPKSAARVRRSPKKKSKLNKKNKIFLESIGLKLK